MLWSAEQCVATVLLFYKVKSALSQFFLGVSHSGFKDQEPDEQELILSSTVPFFLYVYSGREGFTILRGLGISLAVLSP